MIGEAFNRSRDLTEAALILERVANRDLSKYGLAADAIKTRDRQAFLKNVRAREMKKMAAQLRTYR